MARSKADALVWTFIHGEWLILTSPGMLKIEDIVPLFAQALFLQQKKYWDGAITLYGKLIELKPDWDWPYNNQGAAYYEKGEPERALADFNQTLTINFRFPLAEAALFLLRCLGLALASA